MVVEAWVRGLGFRTLRLGSVGAVVFLSKVFGHIIAIVRNPKE